MFSLNTLHLMSIPPLQLRVCKVAIIKKETYSFLSLFIPFFTHSLFLIQQFLNLLITEKKIADV